MKIQINFGDVQRSDALVEHVEQEIAHTLKHLTERITRIEVHLRDENAQKSGPRDKRCSMEARPAGLDPMIVDATDGDIYTAVKKAAQKLERALKHRFDKMDSR